MRPDVSAIARNVVGALKATAASQSLGWLLVKLVFIVCASALAAVAQFMASPTPGVFNPWHVTGIFAAVVAGLGGIILTLKEKDSARELSVAHEALEAARTLRTELLEALGEYDGQAQHLERLKELYLAIRSMRSVLESAKGIALTDVSLTELLLRSAKRSLSIALDFKLQEHWTLTIYRAEKDVAEDRWVLRAIATERSIACDISKARLWPEGVGPGGQCLASGLEVAVPDTELDGMASVLDIGPMSRPDDQQLYRSMFAAPIILSGQKRPWGVVMASSSRPDHFECRGPIGVRTSEAVRVLADMVALGLAVQAPTVTTGSPTTALVTGSNSGPSAGQGKPQSGKP